MIANLKVAFDECNGGGGDELSAADVRQVLSRLGVDASTTAVHEWIAERDLDGDGRVSFVEFAMAFAQRLRGGGVAGFAGGGKEAVANFRVSTTRDGAHVSTAPNARYRQWFETRSEELAIEQLRGGGDNDGSMMRAPRLRISARRAPASLSECASFTSTIPRLTPATALASVPAPLAARHAPDSSMRTAQTRRGAGPGGGANRDARGHPQHEERAGSMVHGGRSLQRDGGLAHTQAATQAARPRRAHDARVRSPEARVPPRGHGPGRGDHAL